MNKIFCQNCGAQWEAQADLSSYPFLRFEPSIEIHPNQEISLGELYESGYELVTCPKCPIPNPSSSDQPQGAGGTGSNLFYKGSDRRKAGDEDQPKPTGSGGVTHTGELP